ncbi:phage tail sheath family protein [Paenibacillus polymyxa]|nr:phage tail sheath family protein [Paenibacillus polymyxa]
MTEYHGIKTQELFRDRSGSTVQTATLPVFFGAAPVNMTQSRTSVTNKSILVSSMDEFEYYFGYSDDWASFPLCEAAFYFFEIAKLSPAVFINVLDPATDNTTVVPAAATFTNGVYTAADSGVVNSTVIVKSSDGATTYVAGTDYATTYDDNGKTVVTIIPGGTIPANTTVLQVGYSKLDPSKVTAAKIIGGENSTTGVRTGLEVIEEVFLTTRLVPNLLVAPGWSSDPTVYAAMVAKSLNINGLFEAHVIADLDASERYINLVNWKNDNRYTSPYSFNVWPKAKYDDVTYHMSVVAAARAVATDADNGGMPFESPSNKAIFADSLVMEDGSEAYVPFNQANYLNNNGIVTGLNMGNGWRLWGNRTAAFPALTDAQRAFIPVRRMFSWVKNNIVIQYWNKIDGSLNNRLIGEITDDVNFWLNGLVAAGALLGGRIEYRVSDNPISKLEDGILTYRLFITPPSPAQDIEFIVTYDLAYLATLGAAA